MAFTKIASPGIDTTGSYTVQELNTVGVMTAGTVQVGAATTVHTTGIDLGSGNITSHNINSTGIITATSFVGPVTGAITGTATNAQGLTGSPSITVTDITASGNVSIGGTLTYEDVTNIDSVGIITAQSGINVTGGNLDIGGATHSRNLTVHDATNSVILIEGASNGTSNLMFADENDEDVGMLGYNHASNYLAFTVNAEERLRISSTGLVGIGTDNLTSNLTIAEDHVSTNAELAINYTGSGNRTSAIRFQRGGTNYGYIAGAGFMLTTGAQDDLAIAPVSGKNLLFGIGNSEKLRVTTAGNVGVGTTNAQAKLDVIGEIRAAGIAITESYPTISPSLNLNFAKSRSLGPHVTFSRTSNATYVGRDGLIKTVGYDEPRFDHDPTTGESLGLLSEEERTNYCGNSEMLANWGGGTAGDTFTASSGAQLSVNPDGSSPAYHYSPSSNAGHHRFNRTVTLPTLNTNYVVSLFVKRVTAGSVSNLNRYIELEATGSWNGNSPGTGQSGANGGTAVTFDMQNLAIQSKTDNTDGYVGDAKIENYGNGWYRLSYVFNPGIGSNFTGYVWWGHPATLGGDTGGETGNGNPSFYFWGASVENGSFITSHIPTPANTSATRQPDRARIVGKSFSDFFNATEGTLIVQGRTAAGNSLQFTNQPIISINAGNSTNRIIMFDRDGGTLEWNVVDGSSANGSGVLLDNTTSYTGANDYIMCGTYKNGAPTRAVANGLGANGTIIESSGKNDTVNTFTTMDIGNELGTRECSSPIKQVRYYPLSLSDDQIKTLVK